MEESQIPFSRRVYSGRGTHLDSLLTEVAARPELLRLISHAREMSDEELETLIGVIGRTTRSSVPAYRWRPRVPKLTLPLTLLAGAGAVMMGIGLISVVVFLVGTVGRAAG